MTDQAELFRMPQYRTHRQYEALRAHLLEGLAAGKAAQRFGYSPGSFRNLCTKLRGNPELSAAVPVKVEFDLQFTLMASSQDRLLTVRDGSGKEAATSRTLCRNFVKTSSEITIVGD